jgi:hypothetical protein
MGNLAFSPTAFAVVALLASTSHADAQVGVQGDPIKVRSVRAGETYSDVFVIRNGTALAQEVRIYQTDYTRSGATTVYGSPGTTPRSNARWLTLGPGRIVLGPGATLDVPFTVAVPATLPAPGSYWSMVMVEPVPRGTPESSLAPPDRNHTLTITARIRSAVQIVSNVGDNLKRDAQFEAPQALVTKDSSRGIQVDLRNTGTIAFVPIFTAELYASDGTHLHTLSAVRELTYPGHSLRQQFDFGKLPAGKYRAVVTVDAGENAVFGAQYTFTF